MIQSSAIDTPIVFSFAETVAQKFVQLCGNFEVVVCLDCILLFSVSVVCSFHLVEKVTSVDVPLFSILLMQELTSWAAAEDEEKKDEQELNISAMTLLEVEQQLLGRAARHGQRLALLQALAVMVETLQHTVLLRKTTQVSGERCAQQKEQKC